MVDETQQINQTNEESPTLKVMSIPFVEDLSDPISLDELRDPQFYQTINAITQEIIRTNDLKSANELLKKLHKNLSILKDLNPELYREYSRIILRLELTALSGRTPDRIEKMFRKNLLWLLEDEKELISRIEGLFLVYPDTFDTDSIRSLISRAISQNEESIGNMSIKIALSTTPVNSQVKNWVQDYKSTKRSTESRVPQGRYFDTSENVKKLNQEDKRILQKVLDLIEWLSTPTPSYISFQTKETADSPATQPTTAQDIQPKPREASVIDSEEVGGKIMTVVEKNNLRVDEAAALRNQVDRVINGEVHPRDFMNHLRKAMPALEEDKVRQVVLSTNEIIFDPIRNSLINPENNTDQSSQQSQATQPQSVRPVPTFQDKAPGTQDFNPIKQRLEEGSHSKKEEANYKIDDPYREPVE